MKRPLSWFLAIPFADLAAIHGDPAANIADIAKAELVFKDGAGYEPGKPFESAGDSAGLHQQDAEKVPSIVIPSEARNLLLASTLRKKRFLGQTPPAER